MEKQGGPKMYDHDMASSLVGGENKRPEMDELARLVASRPHVSSFTVP